MSHEHDAQAGAAIYNPWVLRVYDQFVHGFSNRFAWRCPTRRLHALYAEHLSAAHLDVGVGSGYFLDRCRFPAAPPQLTLLDLSPSALRFTLHRLRRHQPRALHANVLEPSELSGAPFGSIALVYLLHCLPGDMASKAVVFGHLGRHLAVDGVLFGATILGRGVSTPPLGRALQRLYNARGVFGNAGDTREQLEQALARHFAQVQLQLEGSVALFAARGFRPPSAPAAAG